MDELIQQVQTLTETMRLFLERMEAAFKLFSDRAENLAQTSEMLEATREALEITNEALRKSLSENDQALTDMATITAALTALQQKQEQAEG